MAKYTMIGNTKISSSAAVIYRTLTIPATSNQTYTLTLTKGSLGSLPSYTSTATSSAQTLSVPYGTTYSIAHTGNTGYNAGATNSGTVNGDAVSVSHNSASLQYYTLSVGATTYQTYSVSFTADASYGGTVPSNVSGQSAAKDFSCPYGCTATVTYALLSNTAQYTYSGASSTVTKTMTSAQTVAAASATRTVNKYTVTLTGSYATKNVCVTNASGSAVSSGSSYDYGTVIYVNGSLPSNDAQFTYSGLSLKVGGTAVSAGYTYTVTANSTVDVSCTRTTNQYTVTITGNANKNIRLTNSSGTAVSSGSKYNYGTVIYINGSLSTNTAQYTYSGLSLKWGGTAVSAGATQTLTGNVTIDVSQTVTTNQYTVTKSVCTGSWMTLRYNNSSGSEIASGTKVNYGTVVYVTWGNNSHYTSTTCNVSNGGTTTVTGNVTITTSGTKLDTHTLSVGATTNQSFRVVVNNTEVASWRTSAWSGTYTHGASYAVYYSAASATAQYTFTASSTVSGTLNDAASIGAKSATATTRTYTVSQGATTNQSFRVIIGGTDRTGWRTAAYTSSAFNYGTSYSIEYSAATATAQYTYTASSTVSGTITGTVSVGAKSATATTRSYSVSHGATTNQSFRVVINNSEVASWRTSAWSGTYNYGTTYAFYYSAASATAQYSYTASSTVSGTVTGAVSIGAKSATATTRTYTVTMGNHPNCDVVISGYGSAVTNTSKTGVPYNTTITATATAHSGYKVDSVTFS